MHKFETYNAFKSFLLEQVEKHKAVYENLNFLHENEAILYSGNLNEIKEKIKDRCSNEELHTFLKECGCGSSYNFIAEYMNWPEYDEEEGEYNDGYEEMELFDNVPVDEDVEYEPKKLPVPEIWYLIDPNSDEEDAEFVRRYTDSDNEEEFRNEIETLKNEGYIIEAYQNLDHFMHEYKSNKNKLEGARLTLKEICKKETVSKIGKHYNMLTESGEEYEFMDQEMTSLIRKLIRDYHKLEQHDPKSLRVINVLNYVKNSISDTITIDMDINRQLKKYITDYLNDKDKDNLKNKKTNI
jgi:hypothetical protein